MFLLSSSSIEISHYATNGAILVKWNGSCGVDLLSFANAKRLQWKVMELGCLLLWTDYLFLAISKLL